MPLEFIFLAPSSHSMCASCIFEIPTGIISWLCVTSSYLPGSISHINGCSYILLSRCWHAYTKREASWLHPVFSLLCVNLYVYVCVWTCCFMDPSLYCTSTHTYIYIYIILWDTCYFWFSVRRIHIHTQRERELLGFTEFSFCSLYIHIYVHRYIYIYIIYTYIYICAYMSLLGLYSVFATAVLDPGWRTLFWSGIKSSMTDCVCENVLLRGLHRWKPLTLRRQTLPRWSWMYQAEWVHQLQLFPVFVYVIMLCVGRTSFVHVTHTYAYIMYAMHICGMAHSVWSVIKLIMTDWMYAYN
jgi:hypothetical protein